MILFIAYILNVIDYFFTKHWVSLYGTSVEGNPFSRWLFDNDLAFVCKLVLVPILLAILGWCIHNRPQAKWVAYIPLVVYGLLAIYHIIIFFYIREIL